MSLGDVPKPHRWPLLYKTIKDDNKRFSALGLVQYEGKIVYATWQRYGEVYVPILYPWRIGL